VAVAFATLGAAVVMPTMTTLSCIDAPALRATGLPP